MGDAGKGAQGGREDREAKGEKEAKPKGLSPAMPLCCWPQREQDGTLPGEGRGRGAGEKGVCREGTVASPGVAGREEPLTEGNGRTAKRRRYFKKISKKKERARDKEEKRERVEN